MASINALTADDLSTADGLVKFQNLCAEYNACGDSGDYRANALANGWTLQEFIDRVNDYFPDDGPNWAAWCRGDATTTPDGSPLWSGMGVDMDDAVRIEFSRQVLPSDRLGGALAGILEVSLLQASNAERKMLRDAWYSPLNGGVVWCPDFEQQIADGTLTLVPLV